MTFNIGNQTGGVVNNVAGNQTVNDGQHGTAVSTGAAQEAAELLRSLVHANIPGLGQPETAELQGEVDAIADEMKKSEPDKAQVEGRLSKVTQVLKGAGALVGAGAALIAPITAIANWLGPIGASILGLLAI